MAGLRERLARRIWTPPPPPKPPRDPELVALDRLRDAWKDGPVRDDRINEHLALVLEKSGVSGGRVLEIGGRGHPRHRVFDADRFEYLDLDLAETGPGVIIGDITHCPEIPDASFDVVLSVDVFEHIDRPWLAGEEIVRILRPGGLVYTSTLFSWRYHPCPIDYWRYTPEALAFLMRGTDTIDQGFDATERRRDVRKKAAEDPMPFDALGGWRENVRVFHAGVKPA
ncbi:class I SAM-dependent methyltransferase [Aeromicrobium sp. 50.2.37]|uniref:class I SAM-dependent methyltransferase n=1 Tax=Aeromicrobium sp. 50.2.37 TaxID=2969305 RepID=UPI00214FD0C2|nr:class I SAM-dependent methyltransferase [Aeromicrobium sp. 50.2.37]MCR4512784.1 methyltransferase domain-containing protein [Aeromicrobium sp. 50.2.37]